MNQYEQKLEDRVLALEKSQLKTEERQKEILDLLRPIADTYKSATTMGKWVMAALIFLSVIIGIVIGLKNLIK